MVLDEIKNMKIRAQNDKIIPGAIYRESQMNLIKKTGSIEDIAVSLPDFYSISSTLYRKKWKNYPRLFVRELAKIMPECSNV